nr:helix-turn-helix transcriptional regulator [uncultured Flavobacterium sp.]
MKLWLLQINDESDKQIIESNLLEKEFQNTNNTEIKLLKLLEKFEEEKGFLEPLKLEDLAIKLGTNRTTLSGILNEHKDNFLNYINKLRINQLLTDLTIDLELRNKTISELSELYGFVNEKTFSTHFKKITGLTPSYFIKQLEFNN